MPRPQKKRQIGRNPGVCYFKPRGVPLRALKEIALTVDEYEAIRLADLHGLPHEQAGNCMGVSRATFGRILQKARQTIAEAIVNGMAIRIEGGHYRTADKDTLVFICHACGNTWLAPAKIERTSACPQCANAGIDQLL